MRVNATADYVGQVERDRVGALWVILYRDELVISREQVRSLRAGRRRVADLVLSAADSFGNTPRRFACPLSGCQERTRSLPETISSAPRITLAFAEPEVPVRCWQRWQWQ